MERNIFEKQRELNDRLNRYRDEYYNRNAPSVSDEVYDRLFDELKELEQETGIQMANSPTQTVGYPAVSRLEKTRHEIPLLSLDKTKSSMDLLNFMGEQQIMLMLKLDGLTVKLTYENGELLEAATRGDGDEGEIITHNTRAISGIPSHITYKERLVVTGEGFIRPSDFEELKAGLQDSNGKPYKNGRNLAAGSIRLMDAKTCQERRLVFMPFGVLEGFPHLTRKSDKLRELRALGFQPCKYLVTKQKLTLEMWKPVFISCGNMPLTKISPLTVKDAGRNSVSGYTEQVRLPYEPFRVYAAGEEEVTDGTRWRLLSIPEQSRPKLEFHSRKISRP